MKARKLKMLLLTLPLMFGMVMGSCAPQSSSSQQISEEPSSSEVSSEEEPSSEITSSEEESSSEEVSYDAEQVLIEIFTTATGVEEPVKGTHYGEQEGMFFTTLSFGAYDESYLELAVNTVADCLPEYVSVVLEEPAMGTWADESNGCFALYATEPMDVIVELGSMVDEGTLLCQIVTYNV